MFVSYRYILNTTDSTVFVKFLKSYEIGLYQNIKQYMWTVSKHKKNTCKST